MKIKDDRKTKYREFYKREVSERKTVTMELTVKSISFNCKMMYGKGGHYNKRKENMSYLLTNRLPSVS